MAALNFIQHASNPNATDGDLAGAPEWLVSLDEAEAVLGRLRAKAVLPGHRLARIQARANIIRL